MSKAKRGGTSKDRGARTGTTDWRQLLSGGAIVAAVAATLIVAIVLRAGPEPVPSEVSGTTSPPVRTDRSDAGGPGPGAATAPFRDRAVEAPAESAPERSAPAARAPLPLRASRDRTRLASRVTDWTLQFARLCEAEHAAKILDELGDRDQLYLIERDGCYLVCWSLYGSAEQARSARDLPPALNALPDRPFPKRVEAALR
jgi:hypothetical protein